MIPPLTCTKCACLERDAKGNIVTLLEGGVELYICRRKGANASIAKTAAETCACCLEEP